MLPVQLAERSNAVAAVQQRLAANLRCVAVDGEFGPAPAAPWSPSSATTASCPTGSSPSGPGGR
jgi:hypothetical protein